VTTDKSIHLICGIWSVKQQTKLTIWWICGIIYICTLK